MSGEGGLGANDIDGKCRGVGGWGGGANDRNPCE